MVWLGPPELQPPIREAMTALPPIQTSQPVTRDGKVFGNYGINLAVSPRWELDRVGASVAVRLTLYREEGGVVEELEDATRSVVYGDAFVEAGDDPALAQCVATILGALQAFIDAKGL